MEGKHFVRWRNNWIGPYIYLAQLFNLGPEKGAS